MSEPIKCPLCGVIFDPEEDGYKIMNELLD